MDSTSLWLTADNWIEGPAPMAQLAVSTRARYARNLAEYAFVPHAPGKLLEEIDDKISETIITLEPMKDWLRVRLADLRAIERTFLRESRHLSPEMEKTLPGRNAWIADDRRASIMVNEEDHIRMQSLGAGFQPNAVFARLTALDEILGSRLAFAFRRDFGYLTACTTNAGTGLRLSIMLHLPALTLLRKIENILLAVPTHGLIVRGFQGENSEFQGDLYQISNELTLGLSEEQIIAKVARVVAIIAQLEEDARIQVLTQERTLAEDMTWRAWGVLSHARILNATDALKLLSRLRFGVVAGWFPGISHETINRLILEIQPAHVQMKYNEGLELPTQERDHLRARLVREALLAASARNSTNAPRRLQG